jgi:uncharacterized membrane protein (DUF485 family)
LDIIYSFGIQGLTCDMIVHRYEATSKYEELLNKRKFDFSLSYHFKNYVMYPLLIFDKIFLCYKSRNI